MISEIEIDEQYKGLMAQKDQEVSCEDVLKKITWINQIPPDIRQREVRKIASILTIMMQRFCNWKKMQKDEVFGENLSDVIAMIATTEYADGDRKDSCTECFRFLYQLNKPDESKTSAIVQKYWEFQDILPAVKGVFLLEKQDGTKRYPVYELVIGMARSFQCDNDHLLNLAIALQLFDRIGEYAQIQEVRQVKDVIAEIASNHKIEFLMYLIQDGTLLFDEMDYKMNGTLIAQKGNRIIIRNIRKEYFTGYFSEEEIISENQLAWYVVVELSDDEILADISDIFLNEKQNQENRLHLLQMIEQQEVYNIFIPQRIIRNRLDGKVTRFLNPASANDNKIVYGQITEENEREGFLKMLHAGVKNLRCCWLFQNGYDELTVDFYATFYLEVVKGRWDFCTDLESEKDGFYQESLMKKYLRESLRDADMGTACDMLEDLYGFIIQYFDFDSVNVGTLMDGRLLAFPWINGVQEVALTYFKSENIKKYFLGDEADEWVCDIARYQSRSWEVNGKKIREKDFYNTDFESVKESGKTISPKDQQVFVHMKTGKVMICMKLEKIRRKISKICEIVQKQIMTYKEKEHYLNENLGRLLCIMDAGDIDHTGREFFRCDNKTRESVYLYKIFWHFQVFEFTKDRIEIFWRLILYKHYRGMVEDKQTIIDYFQEMQRLAQEDGTLVMAKESSGNDSTLQYLYERFAHQNGKRSYVSWAFDEGKINRNLRWVDDKIEWRKKPLKKIVFMADNLMKGGSMQKLLSFHLLQDREGGTRKVFGRRDYLCITPSVQDMMEKISNLNIEVHVIFGFQKAVEMLEEKYPVKIIIHKIIPADFYSDQETVELIQDLYGEDAAEGICCAFRYNNLPAKNVLPEYVCEYHNRVGLFQRSVEL